MTPQDRMEVLTPFPFHQSSKDKKLQDLQAMPKSTQQVPNTLTPPQFFQVSDKFLFCRILLGFIESPLLFFQSLHTPLHPLPPYLMLAMPLLDPLLEPEDRPLGEPEGPKSKLLIYHRCAEESISAFRVFENHI
jgi:hypothetical protein